MSKSLPEASITFVGIKEFRRDVAKYANDVKKGKCRVVVTSRNKPLFLVTPLPEEVYAEGLVQAVRTAEAEQKAGNVLTQSEVEALFA